MRTIPVQAVAEKVSQAVQEVNFFTPSVFTATLERRFTRMNPPRPVNWRWSIYLKIEPLLLSNAFQCARIQE
jgi:hypothetical protein